MLGNVETMLGRAEEGLAHMEIAKRLNPRYPFWYLFVVGRAHFNLGNYDETIRNMKLATDRNPNAKWPHRYLAAAYGHLGRLDDAEWELEELRGLGFEPTIVNVRAVANIQDPDNLAHYLEGLRKAGAPEQ